MTLLLMTWMMLRMLLLLLLLGRRQRIIFPLRASKILPFDQQPTHPSDLLQIDRVAAMRQNCLLNTLDRRRRRHVQETWDIFHEPWDTVRDLTVQGMRGVGRRAGMFVSEDGDLRERRGDARSGVVGVAADGEFTFGIEFAADADVVRVGF